MTSEPAPLDETRMRAQEAVDATATAYTEDPAVDVDSRLAEEVARRGLTVDAQWLAQMARGIRSGHHVLLDVPDPGSAGG